MTNSPLKRRQLRFNYFVNKQNESLELLFFCFRCFAEQILRKFNSKDFMSDERKIENETIKYSVNRRKQTNANEMKRKRNNLTTESCLSASEHSGNWGGITVYSIKLPKSRRSKKTKIWIRAQKFFPCWIFILHVYIAPKTSFHHV